MKIEDHGQMVYIRLSDDKPSIGTDEDAELIIVKENKLCAIRIWMKEVLESVPGGRPQDILADCVAGGWQLFVPAEEIRRVYYEAPGRGWELGEPYDEYVARRRGDCDFRPWMFYQFSPAQGPLEIVDSNVTLDLNEARRKVVGIEVDLGGRRTFHL